jgi:hypothetical protein
MAVSMRNQYGRKLPFALFAAPLTCAPPFAPFAAPTPIFGDATRNDGLLPA